MKEWFKKIFNEDNVKDAMMGLGASVLIFIGGKINSKLSEKKLDQKIDEKVLKALEANNAITDTHND